MAEGLKHAKVTTHRWAKGKGIVSRRMRDHPGYKTYVLGPVPAESGRGQGAGEHGLGWPLRSPRCEGRLGLGLRGLRRSQQVRNRGGDLRLQRAQRPRVQPGGAAARRRGLGLPELVAGQGTQRRLRQCGRRHTDGHTGRRRRPSKWRSRRRREEQRQRRHVQNQLGAQGQRREVEEQRGRNVQDHLSRS